MVLAVIKTEQDMERIRLAPQDTAVAFSSGLADKIRGRGIKCLIPDFKSASELSIQWMKTWPDKKLDGKSFKEMFSFDGFSIWWLMENWLYYSPIRPMKPALETIAALKHIIDSTPGYVAFSDDGSPVSDAIRLISGNRAMPVKTGSSYWKARALAMRMFFDLSFSLRKAVWNMLSSIFKPAAGRGKIVLFSVYDWEVLRKDGKIIRQDTYIAPLLKHLGKKGVKIMGIPVGRFLGIRNTLNKLTSGMKFRTIESYPIDAEKFCKIRKKIEHMWATTRENQRFVESMNFCGVNIYELALKQFDAYFFGRWKSHLRDYMLLESMLSAEKPRVAVYPAEMSEFGREIFYIASKLKIRSIAMQHGVFGNRLNVYHTRKELEGRYRCPIPDKTAVYGSAFKDTLVKGCNYPVNAVVVTGAQRFDRIMERGEDIRKALSIPEIKRIVVLATSPVSRSENDALARAVFSAVKQFSDVQLVVKIHPNESSGLYNKIKADVKSDAILTKNIDLYDALRSCDAAITYLSTAGMEALLLNKPLIVVNLTGRPDVVPYVKEKAAIGVYKEEDIEKALRTVLYGNWKKELCRGMNEFVEKYAYKNDGMASKRIVRLIKE